MIRAAPCERPAIRPPALSRAAPAGPSIYWRTSPISPARKSLIEHFFSPCGGGAPQPQGQKYCSIRLFREGKMVDVRQYIDGPAGAARLNAGGLVAGLAQGA